MRKALVGQIFLAAVVLLLWPLGLLAAHFTFGVDSPAALLGITYLPNQTVVYDGATFVVGLPLDSSVHVNALDALGDGSILFSPEAPVTLGGTTYLPCDVVRYVPTSAAYSMYLQGATIGLPPSVRIDALAKNLSGQLVISIDAPWLPPAGTTTFMPYDLLVVSGVSVSRFVDPSLLGFLPGMDVCGVEIASSSLFFVNFDAPVTLSGTTYLPGDVVQASNGPTGWTLSLYARPTGFPAGAAMADFYFDSPGRVPDGHFVSGTPLTIVKSLLAPGSLDLSWGPTCLTGGATGYAVYEGAIGTWYSHNTQAACGVPGTSTTITPSSGSRYYVVVPTNGPVEGSYGANSDGVQRPRSSSPCVASQRITPCP